MIKQQWTLLKLTNFLIRNPTVYRICSFTMALEIPVSHLKPPELIRSLLPFGKNKYKRVWRYLCKWNNIIQYHPVANEKQLKKLLKKKTWKKNWKKKPEKKPEKKNLKKNLDKSASSNRATKPNVGIEANFRGFFIPVKWFVDLNLMKQVIFDLRMVNK